jgi:prevent-host-death family protein
MTPEDTTMTSISSNEARNNLGRLLRMVSKDEENFVIKVRGEPTAVLISYAEYEEINGLKKLRKRWQALEKLRAIRKQVQARTVDLSDQEAYQLAGFGEKAIKDIIQHEQQPTVAPGL